MNLHDIAQKGPIPSYNWSGHLPCKFLKVNTYAVFFRVQGHMHRQNPFFLIRRVALPKRRMKNRRVAPLNIPDTTALSKI